MQSFLNIANASNSVEQAEIYHRLHLPSPLGYRTALVLPEWSEMLREMRACVVPAFSELANIPILSIAVSTEFFQSLERSAGIAFRALLFSVNSTHADMYIHTMQSHTESVAVVFNARDPVLAEALQQWHGIGYIPAIACDDSDRMGFIRLPCMQENIALLANAARHPKPTTTNRIVLLATALRIPQNFLALPANATITVVATPHTLAEVVGAIGDEFHPGEIANGKR